MKYLVILLLFLTACDGAKLRTLSSGSLEGGTGCKIKARTSSNSTFSSNILLNEFEKAGKKAIWTQKNKIQSNTLSAGLELSVLVNRYCLERKKLKDVSFLTQELKQILPVRKNKKLTRVEAYTVKLPFDISLLELEKIADEDECIEGLTEETYIEPQSVVPNDPLLSQQSHMKAINYLTAFEPAFTGIKRLTGEYIVAVIDTGVYLGHPDLINRWWSNSGEIKANGIDDDGNGIIDDYNGANFSSNPATGGVDSISYAYHGTHVSGFIGADTNNGIGVSGIMGMNTKIMPIALWPVVVGGGNTNGNAPMSVVDRGIRYAVDEGARVINISMRGEALSPAIQAALVYAVNHGVIVIVSAGNDAKEIGVNGYTPVPAYYAKDLDGVMAVAATDSNGGGVGAGCTFTSYSTTYVEIAAPGCDMSIFTQYGGHGILSTITPGMDSSGYGWVQGTSMASPISAGVAIYTYALLKELTTLNVTPALVEDVMKKGSMINPNLVGVTMGAKQVDMYGIYDYIQKTYVNPTPPGGGGDDDGGGDTPPGECP